MSYPAVKVLGINITIEDKEKILEETRKYLHENSKLKYQKSDETVKPFIILTPNPEQIVYAHDDAHFASILNWADVTIPDGIGVVWAAQFLERKPFGKKETDVLKRIPGVEFMQDLVRQAANEGFAIGLIGGMDGLAVKTLECLREKHSQLRGWGIDGPKASVLQCSLQLHTVAEVSANGKNNATAISTGIPIDPMAGVQVATDGKIPVESYMDRLIREVTRSRIDILFVGLGAPKQEYFIEQFSEAWLRAEKLMKRRIEPDVPLVELHPLIIMAVGGSFDIITGKTPRAPMVMRERGFEWLWRLFRQPWRLKRQFALLRFILLSVKARMLKEV
jgi:N-acetylglucosaminyldiphosphoundecaprenol N-acetyl-beta-D-mannosaminyltransferase